MAKVEIEIDDGLLSSVMNDGFIPVSYRHAKPHETIIHANGGVSNADFGTSYRCIIVEPIPDDSIPFPDWVPKQWEWVTIDGNGDVELYLTEPKASSVLWSDEDRSEFCLSCKGFDTSWVPAMPNGDWTKAKWRRKITK